MGYTHGHLWQRFNFKVGSISSHFKSNSTYRMFYVFVTFYQVVSHMQVPTCYTGWGSIPLHVLCPAFALPVHLNTQRSPPQSISTSTQLQWAFFAERSWVNKPGNALLGFMWHLYAHSFLFYCAEGLSTELGGDTNPLCFGGCVYRL